MSLPTPLTPKYKERIRHIYLQCLKGVITPNEQMELDQAMQLSEVKIMCQELHIIYSSPDMRELLLENPNSPRFNQLTQELIDKPTKDTSTWVFVLFFVGFLALIVLVVYLLSLAMPNAYYFIKPK